MSVFNSVFKRTFKGFAKSVWGNGSNPAPGPALQKAYATFNPLDKTIPMVLTNGNLTVEYNAGFANFNCIRGTQAKNSGKWYYEIFVNVTDPAFNRSAFDYGIWPISRAINTYPYQISAMHRINPTTANVTLGVIVDFDAQKLLFYVNDVFVEQVNFVVGTDMWAIFFGDDNLGTSRVTLNTGKTPFAYPSRPANYGANIGFYTEAAAVDPLYSFVTSLIQGANGPVDVKGNAVTVLGATANWTGDRFITQLDTEDRANIDGSSGAFIWPEDFCVEMYCKGSSLNNFYQIAFDSSGNGSASGGFFIEYSTLRGIVFYSSVAGGNLGGSSASPNNIEHHIAVSRSGTDMRLAVDGVWIASGGGAGTIANNPGFASLGNYARSPGQGFLGAGGNEYRGFRVTKGVSRYTPGVNFSVPSLPYPTV